MRRGQRRNAIQGYVEDALYVMLEKRIKQKNISQSIYLRSLIVVDLIAAGILTKEDAVRLFAES